MFFIIITFAIITSGLFTLINWPNCIYYLNCIKLYCKPECIIVIDIVFDWFSPRILGWVFPTFYCSYIYNNTMSVKIYGLFMIHAALRRINIINQLTKYIQSFLSGVASKIKVCKIGYRFVHTKFTILTFGAHDIDKYCFDSFWHWQQWQPL